METAAPTKFGKYDVVGVLGKGAMGIVYDCRDPVIGRRVAIKTVLKESLDSSEAEGLLGRFKQEAQAAGRLNHPGVVSIYDYGETADVAFIAMEYISGKELKSYFDKGEKFALADTVRIMSAILEALEHAHQSKVVHRDIKPANIMITDDARVKVADFGVAKIESSLATQIGTRVGTPAYMAPEQHRMMAVDGRADLFSCGVILYQFLTHGARPFTGGSQTIARNILTQTPTPPSQINVELLPVWDLVVKKALAKRADERYQSAREFVDALKRAIGDLPAAPAAQPSGTEDASKGGSRPPAEPAALSRAATTTNSGSRPERTDLAMESELEFWKEIKDSDHPDDFAAFIDSFPDGRFSHLAKRRLDKLKRAGGGVPAPEDQTELSAGHTVAKAVPASESQSSAGAPANQALASPDAAAEQASAERARKEAEQRAQQEAEARQREAAAREREEAEQQARRAANELAEREARARAQQEAEEHRKQALQREEARIAAEQAQLQQQEQAKREAEVKHKLELEAQKRKEADEKALKAEQERKTAEELKQRERDAAAKREAEAKAKREAQEQERLSKEAAAKAAKEAQAAKELAERKQRETEKAARETAERARKEEAQAKRVAEDLAKASKAKIKADADRVQAEREAAEKARSTAAVEAETDATIIRQVAPAATATRPGDTAAVNETAAPQPFDPDATTTRPVAAYAPPIRPGAAAADLDVDIDLTENAPAHYRKDVRTEPATSLQSTAVPQPTASEPLKSPGAPGGTAAANPATSSGADLIRVPQAVASARPAGPVARTADDEGAIQALPEAKKKPAFLMAGVAAALVAASVGWFQFTSTPAPSVSVSGQAVGDNKPAKEQAAKAAPDGDAARPGAPASATSEAQKSRDAAEQKKAEQQAAQNRAAEKAAADKAAADKAAEDKITAEKLASAKSATEKAAITKLAAEKAAADKSAAEKLAAAKSAADKAAADRLAADKAAADKLAADKAAADKLAADKAAADKVAADKAAADKLAAEKSAADRAAAAAAATASAGSIADRIAAATSPPELYKRAVALRNEGKTSQAVPLLRQASSQGHGPSSRLLAVIFKDGAPDVRADFRQAERFQALGESQGDR